MRTDVIPISNLVDMENTQEVFNEARIIVSMMFPADDFRGIYKVFNDIVGLFRGEYQGYRGCNTPYHDLQHTTDTFLAMARLMHGVFVSGMRLDERNTELGLISALMHDTGYVQTVSENTGTGAQYTLTHIARSIKFMRKYFLKNGYSEKDFRVCEYCLKCTNLNTEISKIPFDSYENEILGKILGTADLLGQMSDRTYLEKLPFLYYEFEEGKVPGFENELDLIEKTPAFYEMIKKRFINELGGMNRYMSSHFRVRWGIDRDLYSESVERHIDYLKFVLENHREDYLRYFRRRITPRRI